jgi:hypothetical protein
VSSVDALDTGEIVSSSAKKGSQIIIFVLATVYLMSVFPLAFIKLRLMSPECIILMLYESTSTEKKKRKILSRYMQGR